MSLIFSDAASSARGSLRLFLGEMADELLLASTRAFPKRLEASGFSFLYPELVPALAHLLR